MYICSVDDVAACISVILDLVCDVQWKCVEGSDCGLVPSAVTTVGSVECGNLLTISVRLFEFSPDISYDRLNRGYLTARPRSLVGSYTSRYYETFLSEYPPFRVGGVHKHHK
jgi:hypothetical protein